VFQSYSQKLDYLTNTLAYLSCARSPITQTDPVDGGDGKLVEVEGGALGQVVDELEHLRRLDSGPALEEVGGRRLRRRRKSLFSVVVVTDDAAK
jgi:hypothetical protein